MISEAELMFQLGAIMLLAFMAATMAGRLNQTVMIGYIVIGVLIGPNIDINLFGVSYHGIVQETSFVEMLSQIGLIMLMFFVGLEFSFSKLKRVRTPAIILAILDVGIGLFVGFMFASYLGWPLIDSIFLAGVVSMSSTSIAMKVLFDLKRMSSPEVEFLIGLVVVETFIAMLILSVASGMIVQPSLDPLNYGKLIIGMAAFFGFFVWIAMWAVPRVVSYFNSIENDELFILFALGTVFLTAGVAAVMGVPTIIGAFFIGMILAESKVTARVQSRLESFKDAFVAIFFTTFGMMIDPAMFKNIVWMLVLAIPLVIFYEAIVISAVSHFLGFSPRASMTIGTSMTGRGIESILYASVGSRVQGVTMASQLNPFAGAFCFAMSALTPPLVKYSARISSALSKIVPLPLKFSGAVISRTLGKAVMPSTLKIFKGAKTTGALLASFVAVCITILLTDSVVRLGATFCGLVLAVAVFVVIRREVLEIARHVNYSNIGVGTIDKDTIVNLVSGIVFGAVLTALLVVFTWGNAWELSALICCGYTVAVISLMVWSYRVLHVGGQEVPRKVYEIPRAIIDEADPLPDLPRPVYGVVRAIPKDVRL